MFAHDPAAKTHSRLGFMLVMTFSLHVAVILGLGFVLDPPTAKPAKRIDITLSHYNENKPVLDADFLAQSNQSASGTESSKKEMTTTQLAEINSAVDLPVQKQNFKRFESQNNAIRFVQTHDSDWSLDTTETAPSKNNRSPTKGQDNFEQQQAEIAALKARLAEKKQAYARLPKKRILSSVATKSAADAAYLYHWQQRIELIGNEHYPAEARQQGVYGELQLVVSIGKNGHLISTKILKSSGKPLLDRAALQIVRLSSPFNPLPREVIKEADQLDIVRTWQFKKNHFSQL